MLLGMYTLYVSDSNLNYSGRGGGGGGHKSHITGHPPVTRAQCAEFFTALWPALSVAGNSPLRRSSALAWPSVTVTERPPSRLSAQAATRRQAIPLV